MSRTKQSLNQAIGKDQQLERLRSYGVAVTQEGSKWRAQKGDCVGTLTEAAGATLTIVGAPSIKIGQELGQLLDGGYQKFFQTPTRKVPAQADQLRQLHEFSEVLSEALGEESLYNLSLGTVSTTYHYDRVKGRANP